MGQRIVIYGMNYAPELAGVGRYTGEIGEHLAARGHDVTVITTPAHYPGWRAQEGFSAHCWQTDRRAGVGIYRCPLYLHEEMRGVRRMLAPLTFALSSTPVALWQVLRRRPDVVIAVEPTLFVAPVALLAAKLVGARAVLHIQDLEVEAAFAVGHLDGGFLARAAHAFDRAVTRAFDRVITISNRMAEKVRAKGVPGDRVRVIRNWVDVDQIHPELDPAPYRRELGLSANAFVALYSGNLGAKQGVGLLVEAAERLAGRRDIVFVVAGEGPLRRTLEAAAARLPNLRVLDFQPEPRLGAFLRMADLHVLPQERDAADLLLPSKLGGMLASGQRVIVTADPGTELATFLGDSCHITPPADAAALAEAIVALAGTPPCPEARAARLALARSMAKPEGLRAFEQAVLFAAASDEASHPGRRAA